MIGLNFSCGIKPFKAVRHCAITGGTLVFDAFQPQNRRCYFLFLALSVNIGVHDFEFLIFDLAADANAVFVTFGGDYKVVSIIPRIVRFNDFGGETVICSDLRKRLRG